MEVILIEWGNLILRWAHITAGIAWIGSSFYFMHLDASLRDTTDHPKTKGGESWEVHGGGFYQVRKYLVAPAELPDELIWHKWQSYATWITGFFLLVWMYYLGAELYLIDPAVLELSTPMAAAIGIAGLALGWIVYDLLCKSPLGSHEVLLAAIGFLLIIAMAYGFQMVFSGRGAMIHTGGLLATIMSANVFFVIIPNQKKVVASLVAGEAPDPELGRVAKQRSSHNNYLTLPVLFLMLSSHYPLTNSTPYSFVIVGLVLIAGAVIRHFYNARHAGKGDPWWAWGLAAACMVLAIIVSMTSSPLGREQLGLDVSESSNIVLANAPKAPEHIEEIILSRCSMCHAEEPSWEGIGIAPKGVLLDTPQRIERHAYEIYNHTVLTSSMPPNNITEITIEERKQLAKWYAGHRTRLSKR